MAWEMAVPDPEAKAAAMADAVAAPPPLEAADAMACMEDRHQMIKKVDGHSWSHILMLWCQAYPYMVEKGHVISGI